MSELARIAGPVAGVGLAVLLLGARREIRLAGLGAWALGLAGLAAYLAPSGRTALLVAGGLGGLTVAVAGAAGLRRLPWALPVLVVASLPVRIPVDLGTDEANLLLPLYAVVGAYALLLGWELVRGDERVRELGGVALPLAAFVGWTGLSLVWTNDVRQGAIFLAAFLLPFTLLALGVARLPWSRTGLLALFGVLAGSAVAFAGIGVVQWATRDVFWNPRVQVGNAYAPFFRVNSVFWDPSIYGRYLVVAILATLALILLGLRPRALAAAIALVSAVWIGLLFSFSQSSFAALIVGVLAAAALVWRARAAAALALVSVVLLSVGFATPQVRQELLQKSRTGLNKATSGRAGLVSNGVRIAVAHPVGGVGVGGFKRAYADRTGLRGQEPKRAASHSTPVTVAAEGGLVGLVLLLWLAFAALVPQLGGLHRTDAGRLALVVGLTLGAIAVHSLFYNALFEDPTTWCLLGLGALALARRETERA